MRMELSSVRIMLYQSLTSDKAAPLTSLEKSKVEKILDITPRPFTDDVLSKPHLARKVIDAFVAAALAGTHKREATIDVVMV